MKGLYFIFLCQKSKQLNKINKMNTKQLEIVLVEDNLSDAQLTIRAIKESKVTNSIVHLKDGEEALEYIFSTGAFANRGTENAIGLILLDLKMPKVDGIEVLQKIKADEKTKGIPVAVFTSSQEDPDIAECYRLGVNSYIVKPLDFGQFSKTVGTTGLYWCLINCLPDR